MPAKDKWPDDGAVRALLEYLDELHRQAGQPSYKEIGKAVCLAPSTLSPFFTGTRLISKGNLELLVEFLDGDTAKAERLRKRAAIEWNSRLDPVGPDPTVRVSPPPARHIVAAGRPTIFRPPRVERNVNFTGRLDSLDEIQATLRPGAHTALLQALTGLGGVGKTELAIEYAHRRHDLYDVVWSLRAAAEATLLGDMQDLAGRLGLSRSWNGLAERVLRWLEDHGRWLLVFDNADQSAGMVRRYLPRGPGHVLITSRDQVWRQAASVIEVGAWRPEESAEFLRKRLGRNDAADTRGSAMVAEILGHLPLALEQAAAFMEANQTPYLEYVRLLSETRDDLLRTGTPIDLDYDRTAANTWDVTFKKISATKPEAVELLELCAFMAPEAVPEDLLRKGGATLSESLRATVSSRRMFEETLGILHRYSLVRRSAGTLSMHRLVQHVVRASLSEQARQDRISSCIQLIGRAFPVDLHHGLDAVADSARSAALPHALAAAPYAVSADPDAAQHLLLRVGEYMAKQAQMEGAQTSLEQAHKIATQIHGQDNPEVARILTVLGRVLRTKADYTAARATFERAL